MSKFAVDVDVYTEIEKNGATTTVFVGRDDDPLVVKESSFKELIDDFIKTNSVFDFLDVGFEEETLELVKALRNAADYAESAVSKARSGQ